MLLCLSHNTNAGIGKVTEEKGTAEITRQKSKITVKSGIDIESLDNVQTGNGVVGITFEDNTKVRVTENSKLLIDDFVYDPKKKGAGKLAIKVAMGTVRYASGNIAHENNKNVAVNTPTATIAVRGTAFSMTVDEIGRSMVVLLPNVDGTVGEIEVRNAVGAVVLNQAFQATFVASSEIKPLSPVLLLLSESAINNLMIVKPPREIIVKQQEAIKQGGALEFSDLERNALDTKAFKDPFATPDLLGNALEDNSLLNALDNMTTASFVVGYNALNQVTIYDRGGYYLVTRNVKQSATVVISKSKGYAINLIQDGNQILLQNQDATTNNITIRQSGK